jgi:hypothetical protein
MCEFGVNEITMSDSITENSLSENCRQTVKVIINNAVEAARIKISEVAVQKVLHIHPFYYISRIDWIPSAV